LPEAILLLHLPLPPMERRIGRREEIVLLPLHAHFSIRKD